MLYLSEFIQGFKECILKQNIFHRWEQGWIAIIFITLVILWVTRDFGEVPGWSVIFARKRLKALKFDRKKPNLLNLNLFIFKLYN